MTRRAGRVKSLHAGLFSFLPRISGWVTVAKHVSGYTTNFINNHNNSIVDFPTGRAVWEITGLRGRKHWLHLQSGKRPESKRPCPLILTVPHRARKHVQLQPIVTLTAAFAPTLLPPAPSRWYQVPEKCRPAECMPFYRRQCVYLVTPWKNQWGRRVTVSKIQLQCAASQTERVASKIGWTSCVWR